MLVRDYPGVGAFVTAYMVVALCASLPCGAAEWSVEPSVRAGREYNDNIFYTLQSHSAVSGMYVEPILNLGVRSDIWRVNGNIDYTKQQYAPVTNLDSDDHRFTLSSFYQTERNSWELSGTSAKKSLVTEQRLSANTGLVQSNRVQDMRSISPTWTWSMTEQTRLQLAYQVSDVSYVNGESLALYDYHSRLTRISFLNEINSQDIMSVDASYSYYRVPKTGIVSRSVNIQAGLTSQFSETLKGTITAGTRNTTTVIPGGVPMYNFSDPVFQRCVPIANFLGVNWEDYCPKPLVGYTQTQRIEQTIIVYSLNLEKQFESMHGNLAVTRSLEPNATGTQSRTDSLSMGVEKPLTEKLTAGFSANTYTTSTIAGNVTGVDRSIYQLEPRLRWIWTRELNVDGSYRYSHLKRNSENMPVITNSVYLNLTYQWPKMSISR